MAHEIPSFDEYVSTLSGLTEHADPTGDTTESASIREAAASLAQLEDISVASLAIWSQRHPDWVPVLGLSVGLSQEKLKNQLKHHFGTSGWKTLVNNRSSEVVDMLNSNFNLIGLLSSQLWRDYNFGDILVARGGTRVTATNAGASGRKVEDEIERVATEIGLTYSTRTRFIGRNNRDAPCDLVVPSGERADIVVAAKGFDSTGSKLTDAVREVEEMAEVRQPRQFVCAVIDGIGWKSRIADLGKIYSLWESKSIDGMYTLNTLGEFRIDLEEAARLRGHIS